MISGVGVGSAVRAQRVRRQAHPSSVRAQVGGVPGPQLGEDRTGAAGEGLLQLRDGRRGAWRTLLSSREEMEVRTEEECKDLSDFS